MNKADCYDRNLIDADGFCAPFVSLGDDGVIHVGDCDNHETFATVQAAREYCEKARLCGGDLANAEYAYKNEHRDNWAAEYCWHCDAGLQIDALDGIEQ